MTRAGQIMGAMMAMGAGLGDISGGGNPHRERYDWWCKRRGFGWSSETRIQAAEAKRARKAAKRRMDAELSRLCAALSRAQIERDTARHLWCRGAGPELTIAANARINEAWKRWQKFCRGEVVP